jgi:RNA polymerase sigma-B factor
MPESFAALAVDVTPIQESCPEPPRENRAASKQGRLRETFENDLILGYLDLAEALAARFEARGRERADLNQVAYLGLVKAARGFDQSKGESFPAYAAPTIAGELKRYLRDRTWVVRPPRHIQDLRTRMFRVEPELVQVLGRNPSVTELAAELGTDAADVQEAISASSSMHPDSLDAANPHSDAPSIGDLLACPETPLERLEDLACLREAMQDLDASDRELLYRRYFCEETQVQLGKRLGMSQMQVSRRLARVLVELQRRLLNNGQVDSVRTEPDRAAGSAGSFRSPRGPAAPVVSNTVSSKAPSRRNTVRAASASGSR